MGTNTKEEFLSCACAEEAVGHDIDLSGSTRKKVAIEYYPDLPPQLAHQKLIDTLNPNREYPRMGAEQSLTLCRKAGHGTSTLFYCFERLRSLLSDEDAYAFVNHVCESLGYETPKLVGGYEAHLHKKKRILSQEVSLGVKELNQKVIEIEELDKKLSQIYVVPKQA